MNENVTFEVMGEEFTIQCPREHKDYLLESAMILHETMQKINDQSTDLSSKRIAIMAALDVINDSKNGIIE